MSQSPERGHCFWTRLAKRSVGIGSVGMSQSQSIEYDTVLSAARVAAAGQPGSFPALWLSEFVRI